MPWVIVYVVLAVGGLAVLGVVGLRLWGDVRELLRAVSAASEKLSAATNELDAASQTRAGLEPGWDVREPRR